jgi:hypothetical protein
MLLKLLILALLVGLFLVCAGLVVFADSVIRPPNGKPRLSTHDAQRLTAMKRN